MRILLDTHVLNGGGGVQVGLSLIHEAVRDNRGHEWRFALSPVVASEWQRLGGPTGPSFVPLKGWPSSPWSGRPARRQLLGLEKAFRPHVVFTVFGPGYVRFASPYLCGCAVGWTTHPSPIASGKLRRSQRLYFRLTRIKNAVLFRNAQYYWCESEAAACGLARLLNVSLERIRVVNNTCSAVFDHAVPTLPPADGVVRLLTLSTALPHKNLEIIPRCSQSLGRAAPSGGSSSPSRSRPAMRLPRPARQGRALGVGDALRNVGPVPHAECPELYNRHHLAFVPTLLETFSAAYPEAMKMRRPIITTDLDFAREVCGDAALYYSPLDAEHAARTIAAAGRRPGSSGATWPRTEKSPGAVPDPSRPLQPPGGLSRGDRRTRGDLLPADPGRDVTAFE